MKTRLFLFSLVLGLMALGGCAAGSPGKTVPRKAQQGAEFRPKRVYAVQIKQAWDLTLKALQREGIPLETVNQDIGIIRTDYQNLSLWERIKCDIRFSQEPQRKTHIYVLCRYEGRRNANESFRDFTYGAPQKAIRAEEEIYRKLEPYILSSERTFSPQEEVPIKAAVLSPSAPLPEKRAPRAEAAAPSIAPAAAKSQVSSSPPPPVAVTEKPRSGAGGAPRAYSKEKAAPLTAAVLPKKSEIKEETLSAALMTVAPTNVRVAPSTRSKIAAVLKKGEWVEKTGESGNWTRIKLSSGENAWVFTDFLQPAPSKPPPAPPAPPLQVPPQTNRDQARQTPVAKSEEPSGKGIEAPSQTVFRTREIAKMWSEPNPRSKVVLVLKKGRRVEKLAESGDFTKVKLSWGDTGWVLTLFLQPVP